MNKRLLGTILGIMLINFIAFYGVVVASNHTVSIDGIMENLKQKYKAGTELQTLIKITISEIGSVDNIEVIESSGEKEFDDFAVEFVKRQRFNPVYEDGKPIRITTQIPVKIVI